MLRLYALQANLVREVRALARFLSAARRTLDSAEHDAPAPKRATAVELDRYARSLKTAAARLAGPTPPNALVPWAHAQLIRRAEEVLRLATALRAHTTRSPSGSSPFATAA